MDTRNLVSLLLMLALSCPGLAGAQAPSPGETALQEFFTSEQVEEAERYRRAFAAASTTSELAAVYRQAFALERRLLASIPHTEPWPELDRFLETDLKLPGLTASCVGECTEPALGLDLDAFAAAAAKTSGEADDGFFRLLDAFYGEYVNLGDGRLAGWPEFFMQTWDYGGYSLLGEGRHLALLQHIETERRHPLFAAEIGKLREALLRDLLEGSNCNGPPADAAVREFDEILEKVPLDAAERDRVKRRREAFQDPAANGIHANCIEQPCGCDSG